MPLNSTDDGKEEGETKRGCRRRIAGYPALYRQQPDSTPRNRGWQASDRWNRSSEPMQCIGKTPVHNHGKMNHQKTNTAHGGSGIPEGGAKRPVGAVQRWGIMKPASVKTDAGGWVGDVRFDRGRSTGTGAEVQGGRRSQGRAGGGAPSAQARLRERGRWGVPRRTPAGILDAAGDSPPSLGLQAGWSHSGGCCFAASSCS